MTLIVEGLTVVEFGSGVACDLPTMVLADNGARVLKIEPTTGDPLRQTMPSAFLVWNRGKESVALDLTDDRDRTRAADLIASADVVLEAFAPGVMDRLGLSASTMLDRNPALVYASIKAFGSSGPYAHLKGYEGIVAAKAGGFAPAAFREGPAFFGMPRASVAAGHLALQGITAALIAREKTGRGQYLETDLMRGLNVYDYFGMAVFQMAARAGTPHKQPGPSVIGGYLCSADGRWVLPTNRLRKELEALVRAVDLEALWDVPEYRLVSGQGESPRTSGPEYDAALWETIRQQFRSRPLSAWLERMNVEDDLAAEWMRSCEEGLDHPQVLHNGHVVAIDDPRVGVMRQVGPIASFSATPSRIATPAPELDEHGPLERSSSTPLPTSIDASWPAHPLSGITIVELGHHFAMPYAITLAAALGARVIKVEPPHGDHMRDLVPFPEAGGHKVMDGKESIIADVTTEAGREIVYDLVRRADVFALGLRQPAADRMLMNEAVIRAINPDIVYFSATGYGDSGPFVGKAMHAGTASVSVGAAYHQSAAWLDPKLAAGADDAQLENITSHFGGGAHNGDAAAAASAASALLLAILGKQRHGIGQYAWTTMVVGNAYSYSDDFNAYDGKPPARLVDPEHYGLSPVYRLYRAATGWVFFAAPNADDWSTFCTIAAPALAEARSLDADALTKALGDLFTSRSADEWEALLVPHGVGCVAVYEGSASQFTCTDPALRTTEHVVEVDHPIFGRFLRGGLPQRFTRTPGYLGTGCWAGQHTHSVLSELGYSEERIAALAQAGVTAVHRPTPSEQRD